MIGAKSLNTHLPNTRSVLLFCMTIAAGMLAIPAISFPAYWFLAPLSLGLFFFALWRLSSLARAFWHSFIFGLFTGGSGIWWFWDTLPLDWLGLSHGPNEYYFVFASWGPVTLAFALATAVFCIPIWLLRNSPYHALAAALLWVFVEEAVMWSFSLLTFADRSFYGPHFSAPSLGYALAENHYLLQIAQGGGIHFLNFTTALIGAVFASLILWRTNTSQMIRSLHSVAPAVLLLVLIYPLVQPPPAPRTVEPLEAVLVATYIPVGRAEVPPNEYELLLENIVDSYPNAGVIILPEEKRLEPTYKDPKEKQVFLSSLFGSSKRLIISGEHVAATDRGLEAALTYETETGARLGMYRKRFLMPGGEYMPTIMGLGFSLRPDKGLGKFINSLPERRSERVDLPTASYQGRIFGGLICSDFLSPHLYRELAVRQHADVLVNIANPAWFHGSRILFDKTVQVAKVHAVQNRAHYLQSTNGAPAFAIDPTGTVIGMTTWNEKELLSVHLPGNK